MVQLSMLSVLGLYVGWTVRLIGKICKHSGIYVTFVAVKYNSTEQEYAFLLIIALHGKGLAR